VTIVTTVTTATVPFCANLPGGEWILPGQWLSFVRPTFHGSGSPITLAVPPPLLENFLAAPTHPAGRSWFYSLLLFVLVFVGFVYGGSSFPSTAIIVVLLE